MAVFFTATLAIIFPLMAPPMVLLILLTLVAHRYLVGHVYGRIDRGQTGGLLQLWLIKRFATMLGFQPLLMGLILLAFKEWVLAAVLLGAAVFIILVVELYTTIRQRQPGIGSLSDASQDALDRFKDRIKSRKSRGASDGADEKSLPEEPEREREARSINGAGASGMPAGPRRTLASMASMLDMIADTLAVPRSAADRKTAVPLRECFFFTMSSGTHLITVLPLDILQPPNR